ncbi:Alpha/Beta hydrolase protein [Aspergillus unguis]
MPRLQIVSSLTLTFLASIWAAATGFLPGSARPPIYRAHVLFSAMRVMFSRLGASDAQSLSPSTTTAYEKYMKSQGLAPETVVLADGTKGHWIGSSQSKKVILFFHGGGFVLPATDGHFLFLGSLLDLVHQKSGVQAAVLMLEYELAPQSKYPRQLEQAVGLLKHVIEIGLPPENVPSLIFMAKVEPNIVHQIILAGDSAGAALALGLILHISHSHPSLPKVEINQQFLGLVVISPWLTFSHAAPSFTSNREKDMLSAAALSTWSEAYSSSSETGTDPFCEIFKAPRSW